jgi:predicted amidohydrolase
LPLAVFRGARVFDGQNARAPTDVLVVGDSIAEVANVVCIDPGTAVVEEVDAKIETLLPGFIDAHVHVWDDRGLAEAISFGVTTVIVMGGAPDYLRGARGKVDPKLADIYGASLGVTAPNGHGTEYGGPPVPTLSRAT